MTLPGGLPAPVKTALLRALPYVLAAAAAAGGLAAYNHAQREIGRRQLELQGADSLLAVRAHQLDSVSKQVRVDTLRLTRYLPAYSKARAALDTQPPLVFHDTAWLPAPLVHAAISNADSTVRACTDLMHDCAAQQLALAGERDLWIRKFQLTAAELPSPARPWIDRGIGALVALGIQAALRAVHR